MRNHQLHTAIQAAQAIRERSQNVVATVQAALTRRRIVAGTGQPSTIRAQQKLPPFPFQRHGS